MVDNEEQLSALMDGELPTGDIGRVLDGLNRDPAQRDRLGRYQLINDAIGNHLPERVSLDFTRRISQALEAEPVVLAPPRRSRWLSPLMKPAIGIAMAASVTAVAIFAVRPDSSIEPGLPTIASSAPAQMTLATDPIAESRLNPYLVNHTEYAISGGMQGMLPYVRVVSQEVGR